MIAPESDFLFRGFSISMQGLNLAHENRKTLLYYYVIYIFRG
jgi:hypothetical protein